jgi:hypothetical protein
MMCAAISNRSRSFLDSNLAKQHKYKDMHDGEFTFDPAAPD